MVDVTLVCLAACLAASQVGEGSAFAEPRQTSIGNWGLPVAAITSEAPSRSVYQPADSIEEVTIRAQSLDSPYYDELPPAGGGVLPQYPYSPGSPTYSPPGTSFPGNPPVIEGSPYAPPGGFGGAPYTPIAPTDPFTGQPPAVPGVVQQFGVNGPQPYRFGAAPRIDAGYIAPASTGGGYGEMEVFEFDAEMPYVSPTGNGDVFTFTPQFNMRLFDGPSSPGALPGFPNDLYRFGWDFAYAWKDQHSPWSAELGFNPSINTDFEKSLTIDSVNWDGRGIAFYQASPTLTVALGALYWDRVRDRLLPYGGLIWLPNDRLEVRLIFPEPRISYFIGHMWGRPTWVYARAEYNVEAYEVEVPEGQQNQLQMDDWRFLIGARKDQGWGQTFLEGGWVFDRNVRYANAAAPGFDIGTSFIFRGGMRF